MTFSKLLIFTVIAFSATFSLSAQQDIYWKGGTGIWTDINKWYDDPTGTIPATSIPDSNSIVHFTDQSSGIPLWSVRIDPGTYDVHSIMVETSDDFKLLLNGTDDNNQVDINVYGDIQFLSTHRLEYGELSDYDNMWKFQGSNTHAIQTGGHDLLNIEFHNESGIFNQLDSLNASEQIRMFAGTWNSNNNYIQSNGTILFRDNEPASAPLTKIFNAGSSNIQSHEWISDFTYGSLVVTGNHTIKVSKFLGSPKQSGGPSFIYHKIILLEYSDSPQGGIIIEYNNFECRGCIIESITIEDTGDTKFADAFTLNGKFVVVNHGSSILFNGANNRNSEITFNGLILTPSVTDCDEPRTIFSTVHTDLTTFIGNAGNLTFDDALINNIQTLGSAIFYLSNGALQGSSTGWDLINNPTPITYFWKGAVGLMADWDEPSNWVLQTGMGNGCIPTLFDDVVISNNAEGGIRVPSPYSAKCRNFTWTNQNDLELILEGTEYLESALYIAGSLELDQSATITPILRHEIYFSSTSNNSIETNGVLLPEIWFFGDLGVWNLFDSLSCERLTFQAGTLNTQNQSITTNNWESTEENPKHFNLGSSHISVNGEMILSALTNANVTVSSGTSVIECETLTSSVTNLYKLKLNNTNSLLLGNYPYNFHSLILNGTGVVTTQHNLTLNDLIFMADGSALDIDSNDDFIINGSIESMASLSNPAVLKSKTAGVQASINKPIGNICALGHVAFKDINAALVGIFNAPDGINNGNNFGINYDDGEFSTSLYWIGGSGEWSIQSNWSRISGGCPATNNPNNATSLIFNDFGFYDINNTITLTGTNNCDDIFFFNSSKSVTLDIDYLLRPTSITIVSGNVSVTGENVIVDGKTKIEIDGYLSTDMFLYRTEELDTSSGQLIIKNNSILRIKP